MILDVDTGIDDALALLYVCASPEVELLGATCVMGNVGIEDVVRNTLTVLELAGRTDVEVARGAARPLVRDYGPFPVVHGERGLGNADPPPPARVPSDRSAAELVVDVVRERPGEVVLVATGPLTNVAVALAEEPSLPSLLRGFVLMGGAFAHAGNVTPSAEANIWWDPEAAQAVFRAFAGAEERALPVCVGLDVTERVCITRAALDTVCDASPRSPLSRFLAQMVPFYIDFYERYATTRALPGAALHDPLAVAAAVDPSLVRLQTTRVEVETDGRWTRGQTIADLFDVRRSPWPGEWEPQDNARVALDVDTQAFLDRFLQRIRSLVTDRA
jgi:purine nucleosidase